MPSEVIRQAESRVWYLYVVRCGKGQLYTGISTDVTRRFAEHQAGKGAKFLRGKGPLTLLFQTQVGSHSEALKLEYQVKKMPKPAKEQWICLSTLPREFRAMSPENRRLNKLTKSGYE